MGWYWESSWLPMGLMMALTFGGLALLIVLALRAEFAPHARAADQRRTNAREVLALRLARGEIDATEYLERINALSEAHDA